MYLCVGAYYPECTHSLYVQCTKGARFPTGPHGLLYCWNNIPNYLPHCPNYNILIILGKFTDLTSILLLTARIECLNKLVIYCDSDNLASKATSSLL